MQLFYITDRSDKLEIDKHLNLFNTLLEGCRQQLAISILHSNSHYEYRITDSIYHYNHFYLKKMNVYYLIYKHKYLSNNTIEEREENLTYDHYSSNIFE